MNDNDFELLANFVKAENRKNATREKPKNCIIYTRVSTARQRNTNSSLETQKEACEKYAHENNLIVLEYFGGTNESAKTSERKEFTRMWNYAVHNKDKISCIVVYQMDRFSREGLSAIAALTKMEKQFGVIVRPVNLPKADDGNYDEFVKSLSLIIAKLDNGIRAERVLVGVKRRIKSGLWVGMPTRGYAVVGVGKTRELVVNKEGKLLMKAFEMKAEGASESIIREWLKVKGMRISKTTLNNIFGNYFYTGNIVSRYYPGVLIPGKHPAIVDIKTFMRINSKTNVGITYKTNTCFPLSSFVKIYGTNVALAGYKTKNRFGKDYFYYKSVQIGSRYNIDQKTLEKLFADFLEEYAIDTDIIPALKKSLLDELKIYNNFFAEENRGIDEGLRKVEEGRTIIADSYFVTKDMSRSDFDRLTLTYDEMERKLLARKEEVAKELSNPEEFLDFALQLCGNLKESWLSADFSHKQMLQRLVFPDGVTIDVENDTFRTPRVNNCINLIVNKSVSCESGIGGDSNDNGELSHGAERVGFEPTVQLPAQRFSRPSHSATLAPLPEHICLQNV